MKKSIWTFAAVAGLSLGVPLAHADNILYSQGFETNTTDWSVTATRVPSPTGGVSAASGNFFAQTGGTPSSHWGGYNFGAGDAVPTAFKEYTTSIDIFLNVSGSTTGAFDFSSAINNSAGTFQRDFIFNAGYFPSTDITGPGAGTNRFVISASNNSQPGSAFAKNPAKNPISITTTGWYTFQDHFYDNGGILADTMSIYDASNVLVNSWTVSDPSDLIATTGGNRYGWFDDNTYSSLSFDNASLSVATPLPASMAGGLTLILSLAGYKAFKKYTLRTA